MGLDEVDDPAKAIRALFDKEAAGKKYFIVTYFDEFSRQPDLQELLYQNYKVIAQTPDYLIFDLQSAAEE